MQSHLGGIISLDYVSDILLEVANTFASIRSGPWHLQQLVEFWSHALRLKNEPRRGWLQTLHVRKIESVADHSFGVAILGLFEAERRGYDVGHVLRLALVHDLEEAITGDLTPGDKKRLTSKEVSRRKKRARHQILAALPGKQKTGLERAWSELQAGRTKEARLVKDLDKLEMALQASDYASKGANAEEVKGFYRSARKGIEDARLRKTLEQIVKDRN